MMQAGIHSQFDWLCFPEIMQKIGELFLLRTNINSVGSVLDSPVCFQLSIILWAEKNSWHVRTCRMSSGRVHRFCLANISIERTMQSFPDLQPLYEACRSYLEIPQRISLLNTRVEVRVVLINQLNISNSLPHSRSRFSKTCFSYWRRRSRVGTQNDWNRLS